MLKKIPLILAFLCFATTSALAAVDVNTADQAALDGIAGVGPSTSKAIIDERNKHGNYKDWSDLEHRVKGIGERNAVKLSAAGMLVNGQPRPVGAANTGKPKADKAGKLDKGDNADKLEKSDKADKSDKAERMERAGRMDKSDKAGKSPDLMKASDNLK
jgi:competence protein ComEA